MHLVYSEDCFFVITEGNDDNILLFNRGYNILLITNIRVTDLTKNKDKPEEC